MNPAALKTNVVDLPAGGALIVNSDAFTTANLTKAGYASDPLTDGSLKDYTLFEIPISTLNARAARGPRHDLQAGRPDQELLRPGRHVLALRALHGADAALDRGQVLASARSSSRPTSVRSRPATPSARRPRSSTRTTAWRRRTCQPGRYRNITGNEATALGFVAASRLADRPLFYGSYPITPASDILHQLSGYKHFGVKTFQAEDEIAAIGAAIGASYGGALGMTATSGPGIALKSEAMGLAVMVELPLVVVDVQRAGPSTGMPTKTEQADLLQVMFGRNSDSPMPVVAPATPADCFDVAIEAWRIALTYMTPVVYLSDAFLATGSEPWRLPDVDDLPRHRGRQRDRPGHVSTRTTATRSPWRDPGRCPARPASSTASAASRSPTSPATSATTRTTTTGCSSCAPRRSPGIADTIPDLVPFGVDRGELLILGWGSTYGAIRSATERLLAEGQSVAHVHLRHLNPFPRNLGDILSRFEHVLIPEINLGQLLMLVRARYLVDAIGLRPGARQALPDRRDPRARRAAAGRPMTETTDDRRRAHRASPSSSRARTSSRTRRSAGARAAATTRSSPRRRR